jgi:hypothetical protein
VSAASGQVRSYARRRRLTRGLTTVLALTGHGLRVTVLERSNGTGRTGAALSVPNSLLERITRSPVRLPYALDSEVQTWFAVHAPRHGIRYHRQGTPRACIGAGTRPAVLSGLEH